MHFGFAREMSNIELWNIDLLDTDIPSKYFFCLQNAFKTCLQDMSSRHLQDMSSRRLRDMSSRDFEDVFSATILRLSRCLQDVLKTSWKT